MDFDGSASSDPDPGDSLTYAWDLDGDGQFDDGAGVQATYTYTQIGAVSATLKVTDSQGRMESMTILSPDDFSALDISYLDGEEVREQGAGLVEEMEATDCRPEDRARLNRILQCDGRFDVLHFEQVINFDNGDESDEMLDPCALLVVLEALAKETGGLAVDPQSGTFL